MNLAMLTGLFGAAGKIVDDLHTSAEEKLVLKNSFLEIQTNALGMVIGYQEKLNAVQSRVVIAEATGASWLQRSWRPITMLVFVTLIVARWLGLTAENLTSELEMQLFSIIKIGLAGYVGGRSVEKVVQIGAQAVKNYKAK